jgi:integrase
MSSENLSNGKHPYNALKPAFVRNVTEPGHYHDGNCLYLVVDDNGSKRWVLRVTIAGRRRDMGLGSLRLVSLAEARELAVRWRKEARAGRDPIAIREQERRQQQQLQAVPTFEVAARQVHQGLKDAHRAHRETFRNEKHRQQWIESLKKYTFEKIGNRRVDQITSADVLEVLEPIWHRIPETARRVRLRMKVVLDWAKGKGFRSGDNPIEGVSKVLGKHNTKQKHHAALPYAELPAFIQKLRAYEGVSARLAFEFLILTAARTGEVIYAKWTEIDFEKKAWSVPPERMKAKVPHSIPLSSRCLEILDEARRLADSGGYIFPSHRPRRPFSNMVFITALQGLEYSHVTPHGMRSSFRDLCEEKTAFARSVVEAALAHTVKDEVEAAYLRTRLFDKRVELMECWAEFATAPGGTVVRFRA